MARIVRVLILVLCVWEAGWIAADDVLPGTQKLELTEPLDVVMVRGISEFAEHEIALSRDRREAHWNRDYSSPEAYEKSIAPNRERLRTYIGAVDERVKDEGVYSQGGPGGNVYVIPNNVQTMRNSLQSHRTDALDGVTAEWISITGAMPTIIFIPDAGLDPEVAYGVLPGAKAIERIPLRLFQELGIRSLVPTILSRSDELSGNPAVRFTNQPHREFIYRGAFEMGRHVIGYEVQKILSLIEPATEGLVDAGVDQPIIVWGHGEGGLLAMYATAIDPRIDVCIVSGHFQEREGVWKEPIYRNVWRQLAEFGDSDVASLIAPRQLIIEACAVPEVDGPPAVRPGRAGGAAPGVIRTASADSVEREFTRARSHYEKLGMGDRIHLVKSGDGSGPVGTFETMKLVEKQFRKAGHTWKPLPTWEGETADDEPLRQRIASRQKQQIGELTRHTQRLMHLSDKARDKYWAGADRSSLAKWEETQEAYRTKVYDELIGRIPYDLLPPNARSRKIIDEPTHTGYEVVLDVWEKQGQGPRGEGPGPEKQDSPSPPALGSRPSALGLPSVIAGGILLLPKDLKPGEKRPVVVCQHGLEGVPMDTITEDPKSSGYPPYKGFSTALVKRGFIVYAPQNPYKGYDNFRVIQRKSNPLGRSLFSYIIPQHQQTLNWLASLPYVDRERIAFYGLSYGGKTAVRVPPMLVGGREPNQTPSSSGSNLSSLTSRPSPGYCLSICSADFNEWVMKNASYEDRYSYIFTPEYEIFEWNMGHVANYAELSNLMTPRPFMVERGHDDGVAPDEWVAWEYAKVKRHYDKLGIGDRTEMEVFNGPHTINGVGTYKFLHKHLNWPEPK